MCVMLCVKPNICFIIKMVSRYQSNLILELQADVKHILNYLWKTRDYMFVSLCNELVFLMYWELGFQFDEDSYRSISMYVFALRGICCCFRSNKRSLLDYVQFPQLHRLRCCYVITVEQWYSLKNQVPLEKKTHREEVLLVL